MEVLGYQSFAELQQEKDVAKSMDFMLTVAFYGINEGYSIENKETPFFEPLKLGAQITRLSELQPALSLFTEACKGFFETDEPAKKTKPRATARR